MEMYQVERQDSLSLSFVFFAGSNFRALPVRRPRAQSAALAEKSIVQDGLASVARSCTIRMCNLARPRNRRVDGPCSGHTDSVCDSEPEHSEWDLDGAGGYCPSVPQPPHPLQPSVPFQPRLLLQELIRAHCPFQPRWSPTEATVPSATGSLSGVPREQ